jgi:hypothetical protein
MSATPLCYRTQKEHQKVHGVWTFQSAVLRICRPIPQLARPNINKQLPFCWCRDRQTARQLETSETSGQGTSISLHQRAQCIGRQQVTSDSPTNTAMEARTLGVWPFTGHILNSLHLWILIAQSKKKGWPPHQYTVSISKIWKGQGRWLTTSMHIRFCAQSQGQDLQHSGSNWRAEKRRV